eukprot:2998965-Amphidinium_carterae.1
MMMMMMMTTTTTMMMMMLMMLMLMLMLMLMMLMMMMMKRSRFRQHGANAHVLCFFGVDLMSARSERCGMMVVAFSQRWAAGYGHALSPGE